MIFPVSEKDVEIPLLREIEVAGGEVKVSPDLYSKLAEYFKLSDAEQTAKFPSGGNRWKARVRYAKTELMRKGELDDSTPSDVLRITEKGKERLKREWTGPPILEVKSAEEATEIARSFIKKHRPIALPVKAVREDDVWNVEIDVGPLAVKIAKIKVDAKTASIISYELPEFPPI
jgi:restriction endonuclease Mrr